MRFKIGKPKEKPEKDDAGVESASVEQISEMEEKINGRTKNLEEKAQQLQGLAAENGAAEKNREDHPGPHGPLAELTLEPDDEQPETDDFDAGADLFEEGGEEVKVFEFSGESPAPPEDKKEAKFEKTGEEAKSDEAKEDAKPDEAKEEAKPEEGDDSINNLFSEDEEEENPLANLIKSLPDVTAKELIDDLNEIKGIIKDWQQS